MNSSHTVVKIAAALLAVQKEMGEATKNSKSTFYTNHSYADLNSIREVVTPTLNKNGISVLQPTTTLGTANFVETILLHESGEFISGVTEIKNSDGKPQSEGSGISYARRYGLQSMLNVGAVDDDGEIAQGRKTSSTAETKRIEPSNGNTNNERNRASPITTVSATKDLITETFKVLELQEKITKEAFKTKYLNGKGLSTLQGQELLNVYTKMKTDFPTLTNGVK